MNEYNNNMENLVDCKPVNLIMKIFNYDHVFFRIKFESDNKKNYYYKTFITMSYCEVCDIFNLLYKLFDKEYIDYCKNEFDKIINLKHNN